MDFHYLFIISSLLLICNQSIQARPSHISSHHTINKRKVTKCDSCLCSMCNNGFICVDGNGFPAGTNCIPHSVYLKRLQELQNGGQQPTTSGSAPVGANGQINNNGQQPVQVSNVALSNANPATNTGVQTVANPGQANVNSATSTGAQTAATNTNTGNSNPASGTSTNGGTNIGQQTPPLKTASNTGTNVGNTNGVNQQNTAVNTGNAIGIQQPGSSNTNPSVSSTAGGTGTSTSNSKPTSSAITPQQNIGNQQGVSSSQVVASGPVGGTTNLGCPIQSCTAEKKAVCATNGRTYQNLCQLIAAFCSDNSIKFLYHGECNVPAMVLKSRCGACTCPDHAGGCEEGFKCMTSHEGFPADGGAVCLHETLLVNKNTGVNAGPINLAVTAGVQKSASAFKCSRTDACYNRGYCNSDGTCKCSWEYSGQRCETKVLKPTPPCETNPCPAPKKCINQNIGRRCV